MITSPRAARFVSLMSLSRNWIWDHSASKRSLKTLADRPATLLKIYIYGYLNRVQSSRRLEREAQRNVELMWLTERLAPDFKILLEDPQDITPAAACPDNTPRMTLSVPAELKRAGMGTKMVFETRDAHGRKTRPDLSLAKLIIKAHDLNRELVNSKGASLAAIARREGLTGSYVTRIVRLSFLSPDITRAILDGRHPPDLTAAKLTRMSRLPLEWDQQKRMLGFH